MLAIASAVVGCQSSQEESTAARGPQRTVVLGAAVEWPRLSHPGAYRNLFLAHYSSLTPENAMKMEALAPSPREFDFDAADRLVRWARAHDISVHGHTLVWHRQLPGWLTERHWTRARLRAYLRHYVTEVVRRFRGRVESWDVVNEPLTPAGSLRRSIWQRVLGDGYIADALRFAHRADPGAKLYLNEFGLEHPGPKSRGMNRLLRRLVRDGVPLDGVGLQSHLSARGRLAGPALRATMRRCASLGLRVDISEMDVAIGPGAAALHRQARIYRTAAAACRALGACDRFTTWGFTDASTWLGSARRPLPFGADGVAKPAWHAIAAELGT